MLSKFTPGKCTVTDCEKRPEIVGVWHNPNANVNPHPTLVLYCIYHAGKKNTYFMPNMIEEIPA